MGRLIKKYIRGAFLAVGITFIFLLIFYGKFILSPNSYLFASNGDGAKAYYVYAYHIKHDASYHQLQGMNYPFGQTYIYTDGQPAIANTVKFICSIFPSLEHYSIGIYNSLVILSFLLTGWLLYKILLKCNLPEYYSGFFAGIITVMSPQFFRLSGHMTLTYTCFFPLLWYWLIKYFDERSNKNVYTLLIVLSGVFWGLIHPYYLPAQTFFLVGVFIVNYLFFTPGWNINVKNTAHALIQITVPVLVIKLYDSWVDIHPGRPENPSGFFDYVANLKTIFLPAFQDTYSYVEPYVGKVKMDNWEGTAYIGVVATIALFIGILTVLVRLIKGGIKNALKNNQPLPIKIGLWPTVLLLLLAMAFPFSLNKGLAQLSEHIPYLRQFRSLGRFAWPFYYLATVYAVWAFYNHYKYLIVKGKPIVANLIIVVIACVFALEAYSYQTTVRKWVPVGDNFFNENVFNAKHGELANFSWKDKYQAALSIPYFRLGAENYGLYGNEESAVFSYGFSYHTGIPLMASSAARTPASESKIAFQFFAPPFDKKLIEPYLPNRKDILILYTDEQTHATQQKELLARSTPVLTLGKYSLLAYKIDFDWRQAAKDMFSGYDSRRDSMYCHKGFYFDKPDTTGFYYWPMDTFKSDMAFEGKGAFQSKDSFRVIYYDLRLKLDTAKDYVFSFWHYNANDSGLGYVLALEQGDSLGNNRNWNDYVNTREAYTIYDNWIFYEYTFKPQYHNGVMAFVMPADSRAGQFSYDDEIMIRPAGVNVYKPIVVNGKKVLNYNNYRIMKPE